MTRTLASRLILSARFAFGNGKGGRKKKHYCDTRQMSIPAAKKYLTCVWKINMATMGCILRRLKKQKKCHFLSTLCHCGLLPLQERRSAAHLYSQKVSSFISCDSTSGWRSSFSFTAEKGRTHIFFVLFFFYQQSMTAAPPPTDISTYWKFICILLRPVTHCLWCRTAEKSHKHCARNMAIFLVLALKRWDRVRDGRCHALVTKEKILTSSETTPTNQTTIDEMMLKTNSKQQLYSSQQTSLLTQVYQIYVVQKII